MSARVRAHEWARAYRALMASLGVIGRLTVGDVRGLDDAALLAGHGGVPIVRITPSAFVPGSLDPGGRSWLVALVDRVVVVDVREAHDTAIDRLDQRSMNSIASQPAGAIGAIVLAALADGTSVTTAMVVAGIVCAAAAPLYIPAWRAEPRPAVPDEIATAASEVSDSAA